MQFSRQFCSTLCQGNYVSRMKNKVIFHFSSLNQGWGSPERPEIIKKQLGEKVKRYKS